MPDVNAWVPPTGDSDSADSDDSDVESIADADYPTHFVTRHERLFHSHGNIVYPLPADSPEQVRLNDMHRACKLILGSNYLGPVEQVLAPGAERKKVLDLCTGTGLWVEEMGTQFPHAKFYGVDIVPITTRYPANNIQFEVHDVTTPLRWTTGFFDLVHMRDAGFGIRDYPSMLTEIARLLRPGGLFVSGEWLKDIFMDDGSSTQYRAPGVFGFATRFWEIFGHRGVGDTTVHIPSYLQMNGQFVNITVQHFRIPINRPQNDARQDEISARVKDIFVRLFSSAMHPLLLDSGMSRDETGMIIDGCMRDLQHVPGLMFVYAVVHARRA